VFWGESALLLFDGELITKKKKEREEREREVSSPPLEKAK
jgi:hypothetical protein